ncbi:hypothetical protein CM15mP43_00280 [bacterium]|nr:MAG: hypothetical protein CM15mP43_00280 [bacterium]
MPKNTSEKGYKKGTGELGGDSLVSQLMKVMAQVVYCNR